MILIFLISLLLLQGDTLGLAGLGMTNEAAVIPSEASVSHEEELDIAEVIFEHIGDEYEWHITEWKGKAIAIPLPCIVIEDGVHIFTAHHAVDYGYTFNENGKLVNAQTGKRPIDLSITKNVLALMRIILRRGKEVKTRF